MLSEEDSVLWGKIKEALKDTELKAWQMYSLIELIKKESAKS